jgi:hypothetical protein
MDTNKHAFRDGWMYGLVDKWVSLFRNRINPTIQQSNNPLFAALSIRG